MSVFTLDSECRIRIRILGSTAISVALPFSAPYTTAGMRPCARSRRASFLPRPSRFSACSVASISFQLPASSYQLSARPSAGLLSHSSPTPSFSWKLEAGSWQLSNEQRRDRRLLVNAPNRLPEQAGHRQLLDLL